MGWMGCTPRTNQHETSTIKVLQGVELYRDVQIGNVVYRASDQESGGTVTYIFTLFPAGYFQGKTVLDLGSGGGAICFEAAQRGCAMAVGLELQDTRLAGALKIQRLSGIKHVRFLRQDLYEFLERNTERFDVIFALNLLHHLGNPLPVLQKICRASKAYLCLEGPEDPTVERFREYCPKLNTMEQGAIFQGFQDYITYCKAMGFYVVAETRSETSKQFYVSEKSQRNVCLLGYERTLKDRETRLQEMRIFEEHRDRCDEYVRKDPNFVAFHHVSDLLEKLRLPSNPGTAHELRNYLLAGPKASGKTAIYENVPEAYRTTYNPKIFKFKNDRGEQGLKRHLHPTVEHYNKFAQVLLSTMDDGTAHTSLEGFLQAVKGRPVVCLICYCGFEEHVQRLYEREVRDFCTAHHDVYFDLSMRFDYIKCIEGLRRDHIPYAIVARAQSASARIGLEV